MDFPEERKHLSSDGLVRLVREVFRAVRDVRKEPQIGLGYRSVWDTEGFV